MEWKLTLAGLLIGLLVGMTGMGGGSLLTPILVLFFGFKPTVAIGTDILHGAIFKSFGAARHRYFGHVHARLAIWMLLGSAPASLAGVAVSVWLGREYGQSWEDTVQTILGVALIISGIGFMVKTFLHSRPSDRPFRLSNADRASALTVGILGGFVVGMTSVGSGTFFGLAMLLLYPLTAAKIVGTDIFHAALLLWIAGAGQLAAGNVDVAAMGWLLLGSIPGVMIGTQITVKLPDRALRAALALTLGLAGVKMIDPPGANGIIIAIAALAVVVGAVLAVRSFQRGSEGSAGAPVDGA